MVAVGYISISIVEQKFKGAICHSIDEKECEHRYSVYKYCVEAIKNHEGIDQTLGRELCFKTAFFDNINKNPNQ